MANAIPCAVTLMLSHSEAQGLMTLKASGFEARD